MSIYENLRLIITIVARDKTEKVLDAMEKEGVKNSAVMLGRWISDKNPTLFFDLTIEPQREIIYTLVPKQIANRIFKVILEAGELHKPFNGLAFMLDVEKASGFG